MNPGKIIRGVGKTAGLQATVLARPANLLGTSRRVVHVQALQMCRHRQRPASATNLSRTPESKRRPRSDRQAAVAVLLSCSREKGMVIGQCREPGTATCRCDGVSLRLARPPRFTSIEKTAPAASAPNGAPEKSRFRHSRLTR